MSFLTSDAIRKLAALKLDPQQMAGVLEILADAQAADEARKAGQRERTARARAAKASRDGNVTVTLRQCDDRKPPKNPEIGPSAEPDTIFLESEEPISKRGPPKGEPPKGSFRSPKGYPPEAFETFWQAFPNKVGKQDAAKAFSLLDAVSFDDLMAGLAAYAAKTDDRPWCNPGTWLRQGRWDDRPGEIIPKAQPPPRSLFFNPEPYDEERLRRKIRERNEQLNH